MPINPVANIDEMPAIFVPDARVRRAKAGEDWAVAVEPPNIDDPVAGPPVSVFSFSDVIEQGVGIEQPVLVPANVTEMTLFALVSAAVAPAQLSTFGLKFYAKAHPNNAPRGGLGLGWSIGVQLPDGSTPMSVDEQYYQVTVPLSSVGLVPGEMSRWEITRVAPLAGVNLVGSLNVGEGVYVRYH